MMSNECEGSFSLCPRREVASELALALALNCARNTFLEDLHAGIVPSSKTADFSDVKVVAPYGEIPWNNLSRLCDEEMRRLMTEVVDKLYTALRYTGAVPLMPADSRWDRPSPDASLVEASEICGLTSSGEIEAHHRACEGD